MTPATLLAETPDLAPDDYAIVGLATCFLQADGEISEVTLAEPIPSAAFEALLTGIPTSYRLAVAVSLGSILTESGLQLPAGFPPTTQWCDGFEERLLAAARTYRSRPEVRERLPLGETHRELNYSLDRKRVLNRATAVRPEDNVKQHRYTHEVL